MRILIFTDNHFCETSSIVRKYGDKFSLRLDNQIASLNWLEQLAIDSNCEAIVCAGDFFNSPILNENEITALKDIKWNNLPHYFIVGNHESSFNDLHNNSTKVLEDEFKHILSNPEKATVNNTEICFLPYVTEGDRKPLKEYFGEKHCKRIIISHNEIKGIYMGPIISKIGFELDDIEQSCDLFLNGHLHNRITVSNKIYNIGNLTGQNFGGDALKYPHGVIIIDTDTLQQEFIENPYAFNFYKLDINQVEDIGVLNNLKNNAVLSLRCNDDYYADCTEKVKQLINDNKIIESKITVIRNTVAADGSVKQEELTMDHLSKLSEFCFDRLGHTEVLEYELGELCK